MMAQREFRRNVRGQFGFSMIEVLVTIMIVAFGLMGILALMLKGLQAGSTSSLRTVAVTQAYDMADRMRANMIGVSSGYYDEIVPPGSTSSCPVSGTVAPPSSLPSCGTCASSCTNEAVATRDKCSWHTSNARQLPSGAGAVCKDASSKWYTIYVSWDDSKSGVPDKTFVLRFEP